MDRAEKIAIEIAKEITAATVSNANITANSETAKNVSAYFETLYRNVLIVAKEAAN